MKGLFEKIFNDLLKNLLINIYNRLTGKNKTTDNRTIYCDHLETPKCKKYYGREDFLNSLREQIEKGKKSVICLHSAPLEGKSALVFKLINEMSNNHKCGFDIIFHWRFQLPGCGDNSLNSNISLFLEEVLKIAGKSDLCGDDCMRQQQLLEIIKQKKVLLILENLEVFLNAEGKINNRLIESIIKNLCMNKSMTGSVTLLTSKLPIEHLDYYEEKTENIALPKLSEVECSEIFREKGIKGNSQELCEASRDLGCNPYAAILLSAILKNKCEGNIRRRLEVEIQNLEDGDSGERNAVTDILKYYDSLWEEDSGEYKMLLLLSLFRHPVSSERLKNVVGKIAFFEDLNNDGKIRQAIEKLSQAELLTSSQDGVDMGVVSRIHYYQKFRNNKEEIFKDCNKIIAQQYLDRYDDRKANTIVGVMPLYYALYHFAEADCLNDALTIYWDRLSRKREFFSQKKLGAFCNDLGAVSSFFESGSDWKPKQGLQDVDVAWLHSSAAYLLNVLGAVSDSEKLRKRGIAIHKALQNRKLLASDQLNLASNLMIQRKFDDAENVLNETEEILKDIPDEGSYLPYEEGIHIETLKDTLLIKRAQLTFWLSRNDKETIQNRLEKVSDIERLPNSGKFIYIFLIFYCEQKMDDTTFESLFKKDTPYSHAYWYAIQAVKNYYNNHRKAALDNINNAVNKAKSVNRLDQLPVILLLRLYLYHAIHPGDDSVFCLKEELEEILETYSLPLYKTDYSLLCIEMLISIGRINEAEKKLNGFQEQTDRYDDDRIKKCEDAIKKASK